MACLLSCLYIPNIHLISLSSSSGSSFNHNSNQLPFLGHFSLKKKNKTPDNSYICLLSKIGSGLLIMIILCLCSYSPLDFLVFWKPIALYLQRVGSVIPLLSIKKIVQIPVPNMISINISAPWTVAGWAPLPMEFSRQECWSGCYFLFEGIFLTQGSNSCLWHLLHWQADSLPIVPLGKPASAISLLPIFPYISLFLWAITLPFFCLS